ncbi:sodium:solute symporter [Odoribacter lunatus]|uniref:sodium:solute symporter n=1 Tax=Odoribacter lunatus TaxID=2941335 RepID=UPI00203B19ED|nr:sodium:solute symporter [Odoribacter lunatus]
MNPYISIFIVFIYFCFILWISYLSSRKSDTTDFYRGGNKSPWWVVAFGMIGTTLSGVTFISVPGWVSSPAKMTYFSVILGNFVGYLLIAHILLPLYYKLNLTSIYTYIEERFGFRAYKTSAVLFLLSKTIGASFRLFIVTLVLQITICTPLHIPYAVNALFCIFIIWAYTFKGGIKAIVWTDLVQTFFLIFAILFTLFSIQQTLGFSFQETLESIRHSSQFQIFDFENPWNNPNNFFKQFIAGIFIAIVMTGLDQDMMQKNLSLQNIREAKKNFLTFSFMSIPVCFIFMCLGVLFFIYMNQTNIPIPEKTDSIYPMLATQYLSTTTGILFMLGVIAAAFSSANSALIAMTTSFTVDIYGIKEKTEVKKKKIRFYTHIGNALLIACVMIAFNSFNNESVVYAIFKFAGYTYGPLLGLFFVGILLKIRVYDRAIPFISALSILLTISIDHYSSELLNGYRFGFEILLVNGFLTIIGLLLCRKKENNFLH